MKNRITHNVACEDSERRENENLKDFPQIWSTPLSPCWHFTAVWSGVGVGWPKNLLFAFCREECPEYPLAGSPVTLQHMPFLTLRTDLLPC